MSAHRLPDDDRRDVPPYKERGRDDMLRLVRQRLAQSPRVVRLSRRLRRTVGAPEPATAPTTSQTGERV